ncbi:YuzB family protein [Bacillus testis]|uniref:YuzB family protein n=1 Tax=Bacillus testis TaxID=1622072 RepID=UPI00067F464B|nr:YuzB family protein [Bacillus testis]
MIRPVVEFCVSNLANGSYPALEKLENDSTIDILEYGCLNHCGICDQQMYALVNGEMITGENPSELVDRIYEFIEENLIY